MTRHHAVNSAWADFMQAQAGVVRADCLRQFYLAGAVRSDAALRELELVAIDVETTGLDSSQHAIVSIGLVPFSSQRIHLADSRYWVVKPRRDLLSQSVTIHRITHSEIENAPDIAEVLPQLMQAMAGKVAVVHFQHMERGFLDAACQSRFGEGWRFPLIDTMWIEARVRRQSLRARLSRWFGKPPASIRLHDSRVRYGLPAYSNHHACVDALATAELLQAQIAHFHSWDDPVGAFWN